MNDLISIIIPVYKVEKYLEECIDSVRNQTYTNLEIILVDDGSPDSCPRMCDDFASEDSRIRVIHKKNGGLSSARNAGLNIFNGEYVAFVDSDDVIDCEMIKNLYDSLLTTNADICCCRYYKNVNKFENLNISDFKTEIFNNIEILEDLYCNKLQNVICCNKLFKKSLFQQIRFPDGKICEDIFTTYKLFYETNRVSKISYIGYFYRDTIGSITNTFNIQRLDSLEAYKQCDTFFELKNLMFLRQQNAICALIAVMRFYYLSKDREAKILLTNYFEYFFPIALRDKVSFIIYVRCLIFKYMKFLNSFILSLADVIRSFNYKSTPVVMG